MLRYHELGRPIVYAPEFYTISLWVDNKAVLSVGPVIDPQ